VALAAVRVAAPRAAAAVAPAAVREAAPRAAAARRGAKLVTTEKDWMRLPVDMRDEIKFARLDMTLDDDFWTWFGDKIKCLH
jgi:tetraacyldisaccharide-1-P 4'-kinase